MTNTIRKFCQPSSSFHIVGFMGNNLEVKNLEDYACNKTNFALVIVVVAPFML